LLLLLRISSAAQGLQALDLFLKRLPVRLKGADQIKGRVIKYLLDLHQLQADLAVEQDLL
jgi:hypothetical protein